MDKTLSIIELYALLVQLGLTTYEKIAAAHTKVFTDDDAELDAIILEAKARQDATQ